MGIKNIQGNLNINGDLIIQSKEVDTQGAIIGSPFETAILSDCLCISNTETQDSVTLGMSEIYIQIFDSETEEFQDISLTFPPIGEGGVIATQEWITKTLTDNNEVPFGIINAANGFKIGIPGDSFFVTYRYDGINFSDTNKSFSYPDHNGGTLATQEWVKQQIEWLVVN